MKKYITISLFIFWAVVVSVIVAGLISYDKNQLMINSNTNTNVINQSSNTSGVISNPVFSLVLSSAEIAKHNSSRSCWLLVSGKIYDVTTYLNKHPGNASVILPNCGTDATQAYTTKGGAGTHSSSAYAILADFFIGNLNQTVNTSSNNSTTVPIITPTPTSAPTSATSPSGNSDDDDDD